MASLLGLCPHTDTKLIAGQVKQATKIEFLKDLSLLCLDAFESKTFNTNLAASSARDAQLISSIAEDQKGIFVNKISLFPLDMEPLLKAADKSAIPSEKDLGAMVRTIAAEVEKTKQSVASLKQTVSIGEVKAELSTAEVERMTKSITLQFDQMYGLLASFDDIYRNELLPWMSQSHAKPSGLGPAARGCLQSFKTLDGILNDLILLKQHYTSIMGGSAIQELRKRTAMMDEQRIATLRDDIAILERAAARRAEGLA